MVKPRLIFTLLHSNGIYNLSRNFTLQKVGDLNWINKNYDFESIAKSIDELVILNVERGVKTLSKFCENIRILTKNYFMPIAAGGGINSLDDAYRIFDAGADKVVINTAIFKNPKLIENIAKTFGEQSIIASIDYIREDSSTFYVDDISSKIDNEFDLSNISVMVCDGEVKIKEPVDKVIEYINNIGVGEVYLTSINCSGVARGYDIESLHFLSKKIKKPIITSGGAGNAKHFSDAINYCDVSAVSTSNLFNFMGDGLAGARKDLINDGITLTEWIEFDYKI